MDQNNPLSGISETLMSLSRSAPDRRRQAEQDFLNQLNYMRKEVLEERRAKEDALVRQAQQEESRRRFEAEMAQRDRHFNLNYGLNAAKSGVPGYGTPVLSPEEMETKKKEDDLRKLLNISVINPRPIINLENPNFDNVFTPKDIAPSLNKIGNEVISEIIQNKNPSLERRIENLRNFGPKNIPEELKDITEIASLLSPEKINIAFESPIFKKILQKEAIRTNKDPEELKNRIIRYSTFVDNEVEGLSKKAVKAFGLPALEDIIKSNKALIRRAYYSEDPQSALREALMSLLKIEDFSTGEYLSTKRKIEEEPEYQKLLSPQYYLDQLRGNPNQPTQPDLESELLKEVGVPKFPGNQQAQESLVPQPIQSNQGFQTQQQEMREQPNLTNDQLREMVYSENFDLRNLSPSDREKAIQFAANNAPAIPALEPVRELAHGLAGYFGKDLFNKTEQQKIFESDHPIQNFLASLPANIILFEGVGAGIGKLANLVKMGFPEKLLGRLLKGAVTEGTIGAAAYNETNDLPGALEAFGKYGAIGLGGGAVAEGLGFAGKGIHNKFFSRRSSPETLEELAQPVAKSIVEETNKKLDSKIIKEESKLDSAIKENVDSTKELDKEVVEGFKAKGREYYEKAKENYDLSKSKGRNLTEEEQKEFMLNFETAKEKILDVNLKDKEVEAAIEKLRPQFEQVDSVEKAETLAKYINKHYSKSPTSQYQVIGEDLKEVARDLIAKFDEGNFAEANKHYQNLKQFEKQVKADKIVDDSFKIADDLSELGSNDLRQIENLNKYFSKDLTKLLKNKNLTGFNLTTEKGLKSAVDNSLSNLYKSSKNIDDFATKAVGELDDFESQLSKHEGLKKKYDNLKNQIQDYQKITKEYKDIQKINTNSLNKLGTQYVTENATKLLKKDDSGIIMTLLESIGEFANIKAIFEKGSKIFEYKIPNAKKRLQQIIQHQEKNEKFASKMIAEDLVGDIKKAIDAEKRVTKQKYQNNYDNLKRTLGKITTSALFNEESK